MPKGALKNTLYRLALPICGLHPAWQPESAAQRILWRRKAVGACLQRFEAGRLSECVACGAASLHPQRVPVAPDTVFRGASLAKMVTALLVFRLQTLGKLDVSEDARAFLPLRHAPRPVPLSTLLSHTSGIRDTAAYHAALGQSVPLERLLGPEAFWREPGEAFEYSNLAAGMIGSLLEAQLSESFETLMQRELFAPLGVEATFDASLLAKTPVADGYRVLPPGRAFDARARIASARPVSSPDPSLHYQLAAGNLYLTAAGLARLTLLAVDGHNGFLDGRSLRQLRTPVAAWPGEKSRMRHGMGLLVVDDPRLSSRRLWGHQGFAYGAVNGAFFDEEGNGYALLTSGVSEQRRGHMACVNRDFVRFFLSGRDGCDRRD